jgi:hypothetical protein
MLMLKINFKKLKKNIITIYFQIKITLKTITSTINNLKYQS